MDEQRDGADQDQEAQVTTAIDGINSPISGHSAARSQGRAPGRLSTDAQEVCSALR